MGLKSKCSKGTWEFIARRQGERAGGWELLRGGIEGRLAKGSHLRDGEEDLEQTPGGGGSP